MKSGKGRPKGYYVSMGIMLGLPLGIPMWLVTDNPGMIGAGIAVGVAIGAAFEAKYNRNPKPLTPEEIRNRKIAVAAGVMVLVLGLMAFAYMLFF